MRRKNSGVTLVELMITVGIVGILAAIAYPSYQRQVMRGGRADGKAELMEASQELEKCYTRFGRYNDANCLTYTTLNTTGRSSERGRYTVRLAAGTTRNAYSLQAAPQNGQANDSLCGTLTLDQTGQRGFAAGGTLAECW